MRVILSQIAQITQTNAAGLHYIAEKDRLFEVKAVVVVLGFGVLSAIISEICERYWGFICADRLSTLACYSLADSADPADECSGAALYRRETANNMNCMSPLCGKCLLSA